MLASKSTTFIFIMLRGLSIPRPSRPATNAKKLTFNANLEGHKIQVSQINSSTSKTSFHVKAGQKAAQVTINSTPQAFRFCVQPTKATNLKNETPVVFFVNRRHNSNTQETKETKEEATQDKQKTQDKENPLSTNYHTSLPADKQSLQHVFGLVFVLNITYYMKSLFQKLQRCLVFGSF